jgi:hypothetical protein
VTEREGRTASSPTLARAASWRRAELSLCATIVWVCVCLCVDIAAVLTCEGRVWWQPHPMCEYAAATHQVEHKIAPHMTDHLQWLPPSTLKEGDQVTFKATVVGSYEIWWAFTQAFTVGRDDPTQTKPPGTYVAWR